MYKIVDIHSEILLNDLLEPKAIKTCVTEHLYGKHAIIIINKGGNPVHLCTYFQDTNLTALISFINMCALLGIWKSWGKVILQCLIQGK